MDKPWYMYDITVPFGNPNYDSGYGGSHDMDLGAPANHPVVALLSGTVVSRTRPAWGCQVGIRLDSPYNGNAYCHYLHLSAINPDLTLYKHIPVDYLIGWVGGANDPRQYDGTVNPTGENFLNPTSQSSQIQVGFALSHGPEYGVGTGWEQFPPIDWSRDPTPIIEAARKQYMNAQQSEQFVRAAFEQEWLSLVTTANPHTGIANASWQDYQQGLFHGPPLKTNKSDVIGEEDGKDWHGIPLKIMRLAGGRYEWDGKEAHFYPYK